ncbi:hypothetical protein BGX33_011089, partial [Mortierella sp. NVP41]
MFASSRTREHRQDHSEDITTGRDLSRKRRRVDVEHSRKRGALSEPSSLSENSRGLMSPLSSVSALLSTSKSTSTPTLPSAQESAFTSIAKSIPPSASSSSPREEIKESDSDPEDDPSEGDEEEWCVRKRYEDGDKVTSRKVLAYAKELMAKETYEDKDNPHVSIRPLIVTDRDGCNRRRAKPRTVTNYLVAIRMLYKDQCLKHG